MTDKNSILDQIQELLGSEGSRAMAEQMFILLRNQDLLRFHAHAGYVLEEIDEHQWQELLDLLPTEEEMN